LAGRTFRLKETTYLQAYFGFLRSGEILYDVVTPLDEIKLKRIIDSGIESFFIADDLADGANDSIIKSFIADQESLRLLRQTEGFER